LVRFFLKTKLFDKMKNSNQLREERATVKDQMAALLDKAEKENRDLSADEKKQFDSFQDQIDELEKDVKRAEFREKIQLENEEKREANRQKDQEGKSGEAADKAKMLKAFSFVRAMESVVTSKGLTGAELEMHQEAVKEARENGLAVTGVGVPRFIASPEKRDLVAGTAGLGGNTVATDLGSLIDVLDPKLLTRDMGITILSGLNGKLALPKQTSRATASWQNETQAVAESDQGFGLLELDAKRLAAYTEFSLQLLNQSSIDIENLVRLDLQRAISIAVDKAVINGTGSGQPTGILSLLLAANTVAGGTDGAVPTWNHIVALEEKVDTANALMGSLGYLTTPGIKKTLKTTKIDTGSGIFVWPVNATELNGMRAEVSTQVPSNLTKGSGSNLHAIIFGNFNDYILGQWGGLDLVLDPYTKAQEGLRRVIVNSFWDGDARNDESFAAMIDAIAS
jgi:HK97 family phage major capsid protein